MAGVAGMNAWPAAVERERKSDRCAGTSKAERKKVLSRPQSGGNKARGERIGFKQSWEGRS